MYAMPFGSMLRKAIIKMDLDTRLTVPPQVLSRLVGDETVLLDLESGIYFGLDGVGKLIWETISQGQTLSDAVTSIVSEYDVDEEQAADDVIRFAENLVDRGLLAQ